MRRMKTRLLLTVLALGALFGLARCSNHIDDRLTEDLPAKRDPIELVKEDIQNMSVDGALGAKSLSAEKYNAYVKLFGGAEGSDVRRFVEARAKIFVTEEEATITPDPLRRTYTGWYAKGGVRSAPLLGKGGVTVAAANLSVQYFLQGLVENTSYSVVARGVTYPANEADAGIILLGDSYTNVAYLRRGGHIEIPGWYRYEILGHEARHSECPTGVKRETLEIVRKAKSHQEFLDKFPHTDCGQWHSICPDTFPQVELRGELACDTRPWGSYTYSWLMHEATLASNPSSTSWQLAQLEALSSKARLQFNPQDLLDDKLGSPKIGSRGAYN
jgi:hypothetical protein